MAKQWVELARLVDDKVSVRFDGNEVVILPGKDDCTMEDLTIAFNEVVDTAIGDVQPPKKATW